MTNEGEIGYLCLLDKIWRTGEKREDRTGVGTRSLFGPQLHFDLTRGFPILTTKKVGFFAVATELCWFLRGDTNVKFLHDHGVHIWDEWADEAGELGPVYGAQWRNWSGGGEFPTDQIADLIHGLVTNPMGRRHILSGWNVSHVGRMALPPCHLLSQYYVHGDGGLSCHMYQRSADMFLGVPFNIASYALLTHILARRCDLRPRSLTISFGDAHIYSNHEQQVKQQLSRTPCFTRPSVVLSDNDELWFGDLKNLSPFDFSLVNYFHQPAIKAPIAV